MRSMSTIAAHNLAGLCASMHEFDESRYLHPDRQDDPHAVQASSILDLLCSAPLATDAAGYADRMNSLPKHVVSTTLEQAEWSNSRLIKANVAEEVARLKQAPGQDVLLFGSGTLAQTLLQDNLVDQYNLLVYPIVVGGGQRLFNDGDSAALKLVDTKTFSSGVVLLVYQPDNKYHLLAMEAV